MYFSTVSIYQGRLKMHIKKIFIISIVILISSTIVFARTYTSPNYSLVNPRIVVSGGNADSLNYHLENVELGNLSGGHSSSAHYSLNTFVIDEETPPNPPTINPVTSPTNDITRTQTLSGTKDRNTSIYINGYERVPLNTSTTWSYRVDLSEGTNTFVITAKNESGLESEPAEPSPVTIILDTIPPLIVIEYPLADYTIVTITPFVVQGTIDGVTFTQTENLSLGVNPITINATDNAGNSSSKGIEVYLAREPIAPPQ